MTGAPGMWSDFNEANKTAMMKSELISWPVTLGILVLAFGSLVAAGLPLMLTILGLVAAAGSLYLGTQILDISIWAMNFALMFALALGIDYALFVVHRFRGAFFGGRLSAVDATAVAMDTAGKAVLFSGLTVLISLSAVMLVPSPAFRSMSLGIMLAVVFVALGWSPGAASPERKGIAVLGKLKVPGEGGILAQPSGVVGITPGPFMASAGEFDLENVPPGRHTAVVTHALGTCAFTLEITVVEGPQVSLGVVRCIEAAR